MKLNKIYNENCLDTLARMSDGFLDLTVTSPPYDNLRKYKGYSFDFEAVAKELFRVTREGGVVVWIVGDETKDGDESGTSFRQALYFKEVGFRLLDTMIYEKNGASYPSQDKYYQVFEFMFVFTKGQAKTFNPIKDRKNKWLEGWGKKSSRNKEGELKKSNREKSTQLGIRFNIWRYFTGKGFSTVDEVAERHPAIFPEKLAADHIFTWSNEGDLVYDPFMGSGTTAKMAHLQKRNWIGSEISAEYVALANKRLEPYLTQLSMF